MSMGASQSLEAFGPLAASGRACLAFAALQDPDDEVRHCGAGRWH